MYIVYIAAGKSSRFGGQPKLLAKVGSNEDYLIHVSLNQALTCKNIKKIHFLVSKETYEPIKEVMGETYENLPISYSFQEIPDHRSKPWGTADALASLYNVIYEPFILCNSDDLYGKKAFQNLMEDNANIIVGFLLRNSIPVDGKVNRGFIHLSSNYVVEQIEEKLNIEYEDFNDHTLNNVYVSMNLFKFEPSILKLMHEKMIMFKKQHTNNTSIEALLPDFLNELISKEKIEILCKCCTESCLGITYQKDVHKLKHLSTF